MGNSLKTETSSPDLKCADKFDYASPPEYVKGECKSSPCPCSKSIRKTWHFLAPDFVTAPTCTCGGLCRLPLSNVNDAPPPYTESGELPSENRFSRAITNMDKA